MNKDRILEDQLDKEAEKYAHDQDLGTIINARDIAGIIRTQHYEISDFKIRRLLRWAFQAGHDSANAKIRERFSNTVDAVLGVELIDQ